MAATDKRQPALFLSHGGPGTLLNGQDKNAIHFWSNELGPLLRRRSPKAVIFLSAHWFTPQPTLNTSSQIIHDFGEFFPGIYDIGYETVQVSRVRSNRLWAARAPWKTEASTTALGYP